MPATYNASVTEVLDYDTELRRGEYNLFNGARRPPPGRDPWAMDVDFLEIGLANIGTSSKKGKCYRCDREGHWAKECFATTKEDGSPVQQKKGRKGKGKGPNKKGKGKKGFKKRKPSYIRSCQEEGSEEEEEEGEEVEIEEEEENELEINRIHQLVKNMNPEVRTQLKKALKKDF